MALYLKYRPQKLAELDSQHIRRRLINLLTSDYIPHAFLFAGPKGTGKTSAARIVAKVLNCQRLASSKLASRKADIEPCNKCDTCMAIIKGNHLDILEIDAASNRGIDEIRALRENIKLAPVSSKYKVFIIDEVHMLTIEAFNALLKTLEEPPGHAVFILATTEPEKLPATVTSRTQRIDFSKATNDEILHSLSRVVSGEKADISTDLLQRIAQAADGSFRDATKLLEQIIAEGGKKNAQLERILGKAGSEISVFLKLISKKKTEELLKRTQEYANDGVDFKWLISEFLFRLQSALLSYHGVTDSNSDEYKALFSKTDALHLIKVLSKAYADVKNASRPELPLEVAIVEWCET